MTSADRQAAKCSWRCTAFPYVQHIRNAAPRQRLRQADDLARSAISSDETNLEFLQAIHARKTGALIVAALELGGIVAGATPAQRAALRAYGSAVGLAFQITDDLLDVSGCQAAVGKRVAKDAGQGKQTFPRLVGVEASRRRVRQLIDEACAMIELFGPQGEPLRALARFVASRES